LAFSLVVVFMIFAFSKMHGLMKNDPKDTLLDLIDNDLQRF